MSAFYEQTQTPVSRTSTSIVKRIRDSCPKIEKIIRPESGPEKRVFKVYMPKDAPVWPTGDDYLQKLEASKKRLRNFYAEELSRKKHIVFSDSFEVSKPKKNEKTTKKPKKQVMEELEIAMQAQCLDDDLFDFETADYGEELSEEFADMTI